MLVSASAPWGRRGAAQLVVVVVVVVDETPNKYREMLCLAAFIYVLIYQSIIFAWSYISNLAVNLLSFIFYLAFPLLEYKHLTPREPRATRGCLHPQKNTLLRASMKRLH